MTQRPTCSWHWMRIVCALSLLLVAFAHKPLDVSGGFQGSIDTSLSAYVLPDGSVPDICLTGNDDGSHHVAASDCEACRLSASVGLVSSLDSVGLDCGFIPEQAKLAEAAALAAAAIRPGSGPRAPPLLAG